MTSSHLLECVTCTSTLPAHLGCPPNPTALGWMLLHGRDVTTSCPRLKYLPQALGLLEAFSVDTCLYPPHE